MENERGNHFDKVDLLMSEANQLQHVQTDWLITWVTHLVTQLIESQSVLKLLWSSFLGLQSKSFIIIN